MNPWTGHFLLAPRYPTMVNAYLLVANVAKAVTVPSGARWVLFSAPRSMDFFVRYSNTPATVPVGDITDGTACEQNPGVREIKGVTSMSVISADGGVITLSFFK